MTWTPPLGIPAPTFGVHELPPTLSTWATPRTGFYCVDESRGTDAGNPFGTPAHPRATIPYLPAGSALLISGTLSRPYTSPNTIRTGGTAAAPVFITGYPQLLSRFATPVELAGTYTVLQNLAGYAFTIVSAGSVPTTHIALRDIVIQGDKNGGGIGVGWQGHQISDVVILRCRVTDCGDLAAAGDQDCHGITVSAGGRIWVLDTILARNSGDGMQVEAGMGHSAAIHHVYIGRNESESNRQHGFWFKNCSDIVVSENDCHHHRVDAHNYGIGAQIGAQYNPERLWILNNRLHDGDRGVGLASYNAGSTAYAVIMNNRIHGIRATTPQSNPAWATGSAVFLSGGATRLVFNNTLDDVDTGVQVPAGPGSVLVANTIFSRTTTPWFCEGPSPTFQQGANLIGDVAFTDAAFQLPAGSPAIGAGFPLDLSATFQALYGVLFNTDALGSVRGLPWDLGAVQS